MQDRNGLLRHMRTDEPVSVDRTESAPAVCLVRSVCPCPCDDCGRLTGLDLPETPRDAVPGRDIAVVSSAPLKSRDGNPGTVPGRPRSVSLLVPPAVPGRLDGNGNWTCSGASRPCLISDARDACASLFSTDADFGRSAVCSAPGTRATACVRNSCAATEHRDVLLYLSIPQQGLRDLSRRK